MPILAYGAVAGFVGLSLIGTMMAGCGSGNGTLSAPSPGAAASTFVGRSYTGAVTLKEGLKGTVALSTGESGAVSGTLTVEDATRATARVAPTRAVVGVFPITGTYNPATGTFAFTGSYTFNGQTITFNVAGTLPTPPATTGGTISYHDSTGYSSTTTFALPTTQPSPTPTPTTSPTATPSPTPTPTPTPASASGSFTGTFTDSTINTSSAPYTAAPAIVSIIENNYGGFDATFSLKDSNNLSRNFTVAAFNPIQGQVYQRLQVGQVFNLTTGGVPMPGAAGVTFASYAGTGIGTWETRGGTLTITAISNHQISFTIENARFETGLVNPSGTGSFTFNGSGTVVDTTHELP